ncbi:helix-turn-helix domain-containing protein [Nocardia brasiliensis]|uniref:helix-turn-helix domain-containing protein n=1 Tax=Nocardia brasiliensis TaxID=37326 RepID=UPI001894FD17|nr:helix-turn-helix transcriptional regulator [Nocardia brasiliensis]MBF6545664.1 helix-turn-helix transcriptional regulator [Nocardia brasiliensis]
MTGDEREGPPTLAEVIGRNARRLRGDHRAEAIGNAARQVGLKWSTGRVSDLEAGRIAPTLPTLIALAIAFGDVLNRPVKLAEFTESDDLVQINDGLAIPATLLSSALNGEAMPHHDDEADEYEGEPNPSEGGLIAAMSGETERRIAKTLGVDFKTLSRHSAGLWGNPFSVERDRRAGLYANAQKRGRISRELMNELKQSLAYAGHIPNERKPLGDD